MMPLQEMRSNDFCFIFHLFKNYNKDELARKEDYMQTSLRCLNQLWFALGF
jgi:hypothetical protein